MTIRSAEQGEAQRESSRFYWAMSISRHVAVDAFRSTSSAIVFSCPDVTRAAEVRKKTSRFRGEGLQPKFRDARRIAQEWVGMHQAWF
jgi:hypothetical protein